MNSVEVDYLNYFFLPWTIIINIKHCDSVHVLLSTPLNPANKLSVVDHVHSMPEDEPTRLKEAAQAAAHTVPDQTAQELHNFLPITTSAITQSSLLATNQPWKTISS